MQRWEHFLAADREVDLSKVEHAVEWSRRVLAMHGNAVDLRTKPHDFDLIGMTGVAWVAERENDDDRGLWLIATHAIRSVAARTKKFRRGRKSEADPLQADRVMATYLSLATPQLQLGVKPIRDPHVRLVADCERVRDTDGVMKKHVANFRTALSLFWQSQFISLVQLEPVCQDCGVSLGTTPEGRPKRAKRCKKCARDYWWGELTDEERREKQRAKKERQRQRAREE